MMTKKRRHRRVRPFFICLPDCKGSAIMRVPLWSGKWEGVCILTFESSSIRPKRFQGVHTVCCQTNGLRIECALQSKPGSNYLVVYWPTFDLQTYKLSAITFSFSPDNLLRDSATATFRKEPVVLEAVQKVHTPPAGGALQSVCLARSEIKRERENQVQQSKAPAARRIESRNRSSITWKVRKITFLFAGNAFCFHASECSFGFVWIRLGSKYSGKVDFCLQVNLVELSESGNESGLLLLLS